MAEKLGVGTRAIQSAVKGKEHQVLERLDIPWQSGRPHIRCPYPDHPDQNPSWRFVPSKGRAYCACIEGSDSVFDIVMKILGCDFEAAKRYVAETIGYRGVSPNASNKKLSSHARRLLSPPAALRDDRLGVSYLAARAGIAPEQMSMPTTQVTGWTSLAYREAVTGGGFVTVCETPCVVFSTQAPDGREHAHRIYLTGDGTKKADLGLDSDGRPRSAKKSASLSTGLSASGCCVLWGDTEKASRFILAEGIETAAAIALCLASEIERGDLAVGAALSATGIESFRPWAATKRLVIAADRDATCADADENAVGRGEQAARSAAQRLCRELQVEIALPGSSGEALDYLDLLNRDGAEAVRSSIRAACRFLAQHADLDKDAKHDRLAALCAKVAADYPLPALETVELNYRCNEAGQVMLTKLSWVHDRTTGERQQAALPVSTPFGVKARLRHADRSQSYGLRVCVQGLDGLMRDFDTSRNAFAKRGAPDVMAHLWANGLRTEGDGEALVLQALKAANPPREILVVSCPGWHHLPQADQPIFVTPAGAVLGDTHDLCVELATDVCMPAEVATGGSLEDWLDAIRAVAATHNCRHFLLGTIAGFAGPLIALTGLETCGIAFSGLSSGGKSTAQRLTASAWSTPDLRKPGLAQSARTTENAVETMALRASATALILDELAHLSGKQLASIIYTLSGGAGKKRMTADATTRDSHTWITYVVLSGESSLAEQVAREGGAWTAGMAARILDIDVTDVNRSLDPDTLHRINAVNENFGHAGPAFVRRLIGSGAHRDGQELRTCVLEAARELAGDGADSATIRAALPLAILGLAGHLAKSYGILPSEFDVSDAVQWAWQRFSTSSDSQALRPEDQAITLLQEYVAHGWGVTIKPLDAQHGVNNRDSQGWYDEEAIYLLPSSLRTAIGSTLKERQVGAVLKRQQFLARHDRDHYTIRYLAGLGKVRLYALKRSEFGRICG